MLDDLKMIHERDVQDALGVAEKQPQQLSQTYDFIWSGEHEISNIIVAGMGGSALGASFLKSWPGTAVPLEIVRDYELPKYADSRTMFIASSYSGNTEETLAALSDAQSRQCQIAVIAAGGELAELAKQEGYPLITTPAGLQPRMAVFYNFAAIVQLLESARLIADGSKAELAAAGEWLNGEVDSWRPDTPTKDNFAKQIAQELMGRSVVVYSGSKLSPVAYKWKINFNENAKTVAWCNNYPEFNHNEFIGWSSHPTDKPYAVVDIRSNLDNPKITKRFVVSERLLSGRRPAPIVIEPKGKTVLEQLVWAVCLGDFVSIYLALLNGLNPTPVDLIEKLKDQLRN